MSAGAGVLEGGDGGDESGTGLLSTSTSTSGTRSSPLGGSSATSSGTSSWSLYWRTKEIGMVKDRSMERTRVHLILLSMQGSSGNPRCSRTWLNIHGINNGKVSAQAMPFRWTLSSKCSREVITSSEGLNYNPSEIRYRTSSMAPLH